MAGENSLEDSAEKIKGVREDAHPFGGGGGDDVHLQGRCQRVLEHAFR